MSGNDEMDANALVHELWLEELESELAQTAWDKERERYRVDAWHWRGDSLIDRGVVAARVYPAPIRPWHAEVIGEDGEMHELAGGFRSADEAKEAAKDAVLIPAMGGAPPELVTPESRGWKRSKPKGEVLDGGWHKVIGGRMFGVYPVSGGSWAVCAYDIRGGQMVKWQGRTPQLFGSAAEGRLLVDQTYDEVGGAK